MLNVQFKSLVAATLFTLFTLVPVESGAVTVNSNQSATTTSQEQPKEPVPTPMTVCSRDANGEEVCRALPPQVCTQIHTCI